jgi:hypothetical protein
MWILHSGTLAITGLKNIEMSPTSKIGGGGGGLELSLTDRLSLGTHILVDTETKYNRSEPK